MPAGVGMCAAFGILYPLWDFAVDGGQLLERAAGEVGLDYVVVPVVTGEQAHFRPALARETPYFHTEGGWHYPPAAKIYAGCGLRPVKARWVGGADVLVRLRELLAKLNARFVARVDVRSVRALADSEPHLAQRNAWGQAVQARAPCACNPNLRELLRATLADLHRYEPAGFQLQGGGCGRGFPLGVRWAADWHATCDRTFSACFCPACRQIGERAGVDPDLAARSVRAAADRLLAGEPDASTKDAVLATYVAAQKADCAGWQQRLAAGDPQHRYKLVVDVEEPSDAAAAAGPDVLVRWPADREIDEDFAAGLLRRAAASDAGWCLFVWRPCFGAPARLVRLVSDATRLGVQSFDFEGVTEGPPDVITWLKQAVRFARRGVP